MTRKLFLFLTVAATAAGAPEAAAPMASPPPNIVYILADDLGYGDVACYNAQSKLPTPRIDRLATEGMKFTDVHSASACTPTRYGILTGRYAFRSRVPWAVLDSYDPPLIESGRLTVPALLKRQGYRTACIGKWHLGWDWPKGNRPDGEPDFTQPIANGPITRGFDEYFGTHVPNQPPFAFIENDRLTEQPTARFPGKDAEQFVFKSGPMVPGWKFENIMPTLAVRVEDYLRARADDRQRFFLYYTLTIPHEPLTPTAEFMGKSGINRVGDLILQTDAAVGAVLDALRKLGLEENTLVIFASDNGHGPGTGVPALLAAGHDPSRPYRGYKGSLLEGGHRIPFIVRWPGKVKAGVVCGELISLTSLMATCAELTGAKVPADAGEDSHSILPLLLDRPGANATHETLVHAGGNGFAVRQGPWKLVHAKEISPQRQQMYPEATSGLFNVERDPAEKNNLIAQHPNIASQLEEQLNRIQRGAGSGSERTRSTKADVSVSDMSNATDDENARMPTAQKSAAAKSMDAAATGSGEVGRTSRNG